MDNGAHFYRCDFQVHSPRDLEWAGARPTTEEERQAYADEFIQACRTRGLDAVAITDHHDLAFFRYIKEATERETDAAGNPIPEEQRIVVFPGVELTLGIPCQALLLLDADFPTEFLSLALVALGVNAADASDETHAPIQKLDIMSFDDLYSALNKQEPLRGHFTVLPHVGERGHQTLIRKGFEKHYATMPCVGGYTDGDLPVLPRGRGMHDIVNGQSREWGSKPLGLFQTSDNRSRDFAKLGSHATWVKWAKPTAEALRQACLARHSRISQDDPSLPAAYITRVTVSNSVFLGPINLGLNRQYNAFIGGRGTGKSTLLEYIRWALCDQPPTAVAGEEVPDFHVRRHQLIDKTLRTGDEVEVEFVANNITHVVRRKADSSEVLLKIGQEEFRPCTAAEVAGILPVQAYSQKQLSNVGVKVDELNRFVRIPIRQELEGLDSSITETRNEIRQAYIDVQAVRQLKREVDQFALERTSLTKQLEHLRGQLKGLSDEDRRIIDDQDKYAAEEALITAWRTEWKETRGLVRSAQDRISAWGDAPEGLSAESPNADLLAEIHSVFSSFFAGVRDDLGAVLAKFDRDSDEFALGEAIQKIEAWKTKREASKAAYEAAKTRATAHKNTLKQIQEVERRIAAINASTDEKKRLLEQKAGTTETYEKLADKWFDLHGQRAGLLQEQCDKLGQLSGGMIRARLAVGTQSAQERLQTTARGSGLRNDKTEKLFKRIRQAADPLATWRKTMDDLESLARIDAADAAKAALPDTPRLNQCNFNDRDKRGLIERIGPDQWIDLFLTSPEDVPVFEYRAREADYIDFRQASAGQQATALMSVLLNQDGPPLVIDQPEDDLDNQVINQIVEEIWKAKGRRQLIFSSHNANLVVNGDAELVACFGYRVSGEQSAGKIKCEGAIDIRAIRDEITTVMEGGRAAFELRQAKYGF